MQLQRTVVQVIVRVALMCSGGFVCMCAVAVVALYHVLCPCAVVVVVLCHMWCHLPWYACLFCVLPALVRALLSDPAMSIQFHCDIPTSQSGGRSDLGLNDQAPLVAA